MSQATAVAAPSYAGVASEEEWEFLCLRVAQEARPFGFDIETSYEGEPRFHAQLHPEENFVTGISFTNAFTWARYGAMRHDHGVNLDNTRCAVAFWSLLSTGLGVAHNAKFELRCLSRWFLKYLGDHPLLGEAVRKAKGYFPVRSCTMLESYAEAANQTHGLKDITLANFGHKMAEIFDLFPKRYAKNGAERKMTKFEEDSIRFSELDQADPRVIAYACEDSLWALAHHYRRYPHMHDNFIYQLEMAVLPITVEMEDEGLLYDWNYMREGAARARTFLDRYSTEISNQLTELVQARDPAHPAIRINLGSSQQIAHVLYDLLGMVTRRKTKGGKMSTDETAVAGLAKQYPVVRKIQNWKSLRKLIGTYLEVYEREYSYADDGRTHPNHIQIGVPAGRYAVSEPPYQQTPKKYHYELADGSLTFDFSFRNAIMAPPGWYILGFDYSQQELRVLAGEAQETALIEAFARGDDVHKLTASLMLGVALELLTDEQRQVGKTMNFALGYQMGVDGLADRLGISKEQAQTLFDQYFAIYSKIKAYMEQTVAASKAQGYVQTRFGRIVRIWEYQATERWKYAEGERLAGNAPIQGAGTGDYPKIAMVRARAALHKAGLADKVRLVMNMHDALEFYVRDDVPPAEVIRVLQPAVVFPVDGWPPIVAEWHAGRRWGSVSELEVMPDGSVRVKSKAKPAPAPAQVAGGEPDPGVPVPGDLQAGRGVRQGVPADPAPPGPGAPGPAAGGSAPGGGNGRDAGAGVGQSSRVIIKVPAMPSVEPFHQFMAMMKECYGPKHDTLLQTPDGVVALGQTGLDPSWAPQVSVVLGGAEVVWDAATADMSNLAFGIELEP